MPRTVVLRQLISAERFRGHIETVARLVRMLHLKSTSCLNTEGLLGHRFQLS